MDFTRRGSGCVGSEPVTDEPARIIGSAPEPD